MLDWRRERVEVEGFIRRGKRPTREYHAGHYPAQERRRVEHRADCRDLWGSKATVIMCGRVTDGGIGGVLKDKAQKKRRRALTERTKRY